ncbi:exodeoxyribonuclease I [Sphingomonas parva]|uniref:Exodeoxyribonuclease I n=1 Tax=Sphingomonas parva TaxID=2555898 RepID=A0A4Y8ZSZ6_9SPHN|nr:exonuclease domain-containing protein [Sphingomonas parva]TFI58627.1 exodeoxyribonuclease I [Sphingomonas parva]
MGFVFYDVETTGTDRNFDQILQFAAIHTDHDLNELDRFEMRCRLLPHVVPSPKALTVTRMTIDRILDPSLPTHYEMACSIVERLTAWSPAIFVGWNSLEFDEHMLRQALYQCLHPPYLTNTNGNCRTDLMKFCQALSALQPGTIVIPPGARGQESFRLDLVAPANGFDHRNAHDALGDVEATVYLCRLLRDCAADHWSEALRFSQKAAALSYIEEEPAFIITECYFGRPYQFALTKIGQDPANSSSVLAYDLEVDPDELRRLDDVSLVSRLARKIKPVRRVRANASPIMHDVVAFSSFHGFSPDELLDRAEEIRSDEELCERLCRAAQREALEPSGHVEQLIYSGFWGDADKERMREFHARDWTGRAAVVETFEDLRLAELGRRLVFHHAPTALPARARSSIESDLARRMIGHGYAEPPWTTLAKADADAIALLSSCCAEEAAIVHAVRAHIAREMQRCLPFCERC